MRTDLNPRGYDQLLGGWLRASINEAKRKVKAQSSRSVNEIVTEVFEAFKSKVNTDFKERVRVKAKPDELNLYEIHQSTYLSMAQTDILVAALKCRAEISELSFSPMINPSQKAWLLILVYSIKSLM